MRVRPRSSRRLSDRFRRAALIAALAAGGVGCLRRAPLSRLHPSSYDRLTAIAPECAHPGKVEWSVCDDAARVLEAKRPQDATSAFLVSWQHLVADAQPDLRYSGNSPDPLGAADQRRVVEASARAIDRIERPALRAVYEAHPGAYASEMMKALERARIASPESMDAFAKAAEAAKSDAPADDPAVEEL